MKYKKSNAMGFEMIIAKHKGVTISLAEDDDWISIYSCRSVNEGKGEVQEAIKILQKDFKGKKMYGSVPLNTTMKHIYDKFKIIYK